MIFHPVPNRHTPTPKGSLKLHLPVVGAFPPFHYVSHSFFSLTPSQTVITDLHVGQEMASSSRISARAQAVLLLHTVFSASLFFVGKGLSMKNGMCCAVSSFCFCLSFIPRHPCPAKGEKRCSFCRIGEGGKLDPVSAVTPLTASAFSLILSALPFALKQTGNSSIRKEQNRKTVI